MTRFRHRRHARRGFTLVELMVATALVVLILTILAVAFGAATESLSRLRSMGNMATDLRGAQDKLRADLEAEHFDSGDSPGVLRLADLKYNLLPGSTAVRPPLGGFFRIENGLGSIYEGSDTDGLSSTRATTHVLDFTAKRLGTSPDDLYVVPATTVTLRNLNSTDTPLTNDQFVSKWARVRWFLANGQNVGGVTVFTLYRGVRVIAPGNVGPLTAQEREQIAETGGTSRTLAELTNPVNRPPFTEYTAASTYRGDDIVLSNVTSFEVLPVWEAGAGVRGPRTNWPVLNAPPYVTPIPDGIPGVGATPALPSSQNGDAPSDDLPLVTDNTTLLNQRVFDTWSGAVAGWNTPGGATSLPLRIRVTALQVKIRVFDPKTLLTRQVSFIVQP